MDTRRASVDATRRRILDACLTLAQARSVSTIGLRDVAELAQTSVQTVLRHFGSLAGLIDAAYAEVATLVDVERLVPDPDPATAVRVVVDHYERRGDQVLRLLAEEDHPLVRRVVEPDKRLHRQWVVDSFVLLADLPEPERTVAVDLLVVATDVYTWKLLRRDRGLSRRATQSRMLALVNALIGALPSASTAGTGERTQDHTPTGVSEAGH